MNPLGALSDTDAALIGEVLAQVGRGYATLNADLVADAYTDQADWTNAFGQSRQGRDQIRDYLKGVFRSEAFRSGQGVGPPQVSLRLVRPGVAVAHLVSERVGQQTMGTGRAIPLRKIHQLMVLAKAGDRWSIEAELIMDAEPA